MKISSKPQKKKKQRAIRTRPVKVVREDTFWIDSDKGDEFVTPAEELLEVLGGEPVEGTPVAVVEELIEVPDGEPVDGTPEADGDDDSPSESFYDDMPNLVPPEPEFFPDMPHLAMRALQEESSSEASESC